MKIEKTMKAAITPCYGKNSGATRCKLNVPKRIAEAMGLSKDDCTVSLKFNDRRKELVIKKVNSDNLTE